MGPSQSSRNLGSFSADGIFADRARNLPPMTPTVRTFAPFTAVKDVARTAFAKMTSNAAAGAHLKEIILK